MIPVGVRQSFSRASPSRARRDPQASVGVMRDPKFFVEARAVVIETLVSIGVDDERVVTLE